MSRCALALLALFLLVGSGVVQAADANPCTTPDRCMDLTSDPGATCSSELAAENWGTQPETIYTCMITDSVAAAVMVTDSLYVRCGAEGGNATANSTEPAEGMVMARKLLMDDMEGMGAEEGAVCEVGLKTGPSFGDAMIRCQATGCVPGEGGVGVTCQDTACTCPEDETCGNDTVSGFVNDVGGAVSLECDAAGKCTVKMNLSVISSIGAVCGQCMTEA